MQSSAPYRRSDRDPTIQIANELASTKYCRAERRRRTCTARAELGNHAGSGEDDADPEGVTRDETSNPVGSSDKPYRSRVD